MDTYSRYNQIHIHEEARDKTSFMTKCINYRYKIMPLGLKNEG